VELEDAARRDDQVLDVAAVGIPREKWGERPVLAVVPRSTGKFNPDLLRTRLSERIQKWALPDHILVFPDLPRSTVGKLLKADIRDCIVEILETST
jgi:fatty-acyl-CoA synthase